MKMFIFLLVLATIMYGLVDYSHTWAHEKVHQTIYEEYGIDSEIHINNPINSMATGIAGYTEVTSDNAEDCDWLCRSLHLENEIYGYNIGSIILAMFTCMMILILISYIFYEKMFHN